jgi:hypothetical protein
VAEALAKAGLADQAKDAALQAKDVARAIEEPGARSKALSSVAVTLAKAGLADQAADAALQAKDAARAIEEPGARSKALSSVADALLIVGLRDDSREVALSLKDVQDRSRALANIAGAMACAHKFQFAREVAESCIHPESKLDAFTTILIEYTKMTKPELAKVLDDLEKSSDDSESGTGFR